MKKDELRTGDRIEVYRNLHKDCFSIRLLRKYEGRANRDTFPEEGRVVKHLFNDEQLHMENVKFAVQPAGRAKVLRERKKNVHAFVRGTYIESGIHAWQSVASYNPYKRGYFFTSFGGDIRRINEARRVSLSDGKVFVNP